MRIVLFLFISILGLAASTTQSGISAAPAGPCSGPQYRQFDFWVGNWAVKDPVQQKLLGTNDITRELNDCVVQEHWISGTQTGSSFNIYDSVTKKWHQTWIDNSGSLLMLSGTLKDGSMVLDGTVTRQNGQLALHRITYTPIANGKVRQTWIASRNGGAKWSTLFDGIYAPQNARVTPAEASPPACTSAQYRQFDFWAGTWTVTDRKTKKFAGTNIVTHEQGGCALEEHWTGARTVRGMSFNIYDRGKKRWHQTWVDNQGGLLELDGHLVGNSMVLSEATVDERGKPQLQRITWTPQADGTVRQHWQYSSDNGAKWQDAFDGIYKRSAD